MSARHENIVNETDVGTEKRRIRPQATNSRAPSSLEDIDDLDTVELEIEGEEPQQQQEVAPKLVRAAKRQANVETQSPTSRGGRKLAIFAVVGLGVFLLGGFLVGNYLIRNEAVQVPVQSVAVPPPELPKVTVANSQPSALVPKPVPAPADPTMPNAPPKQDSKPSFVADQASKPAVVPPMAVVQPLPSQVAPAKPDDTTSLDQALGANNSPVPPLPEKLVPNVPADKPISDKPAIIPTAQPSGSNLMAPKTSESSCTVDLESLRK